MSRIREGWLPMLALCVACGLWFMMMPLLGYGYVIDDVFLRPAWVGIPPCVFGVVFAAQQARSGRIAAVLAGVLLFVVSFHFHHDLIREVREVQCEVAGPCTTTVQLGTFADLRSPFEVSTFVENLRR